MVKEKGIVVIICPTKQSPGQDEKSWESKGKPRKHGKSRETREILGKPGKSRDIFLVFNILTEKS